MVAVREHSVDAQAARRAGKVARDQRIRAKLKVAGALREWIAADAALSQLKRDGGPPAVLRRARDRRDLALVAISAEQELLAAARAPRRARGARPDLPGVVALRDELAAIGAAIEPPSDHRRAG